MNSPYPNARFTVVPEQAIVNDLASAFIAYYPILEGHRVTRAEQILTYLLADDPLRNGRILREDL